MKSQSVLVSVFFIVVAVTMMAGCAYVPVQEFDNYAYREANHTALLTEATFALYVNRPLTDLARRDILIRSTIRLPNGGYQVHLASARYRILCYVDRDNIIRDVNVREERAATRRAGPASPGIDPESRYVRPLPRSRRGTTGW